eukprot:203996-Pleurochrysis_carterae.AAC.1
MRTHHDDLLEAERVSRQNVIIKQQPRRRHPVLDAPHDRTQQPAVKARLTQLVRRVLHLPQHHPLQRLVQRLVQVSRLKKGPHRIGEMADVLPLIWRAAMRHVNEP